MAVGLKVSEALGGHWSSNSSWSGWLVGGGSPKPGRDSLDFGLLVVQLDTDNLLQISLETLYSSANRQIVHQDTPAPTAQPDFLGLTETHVIEMLLLGLRRQDPAAVDLDLGLLQELLIWLRVLGVREDWHMW
jgi:hypothetical protein